MIATRIMQAGALGVAGVALAAQVVGAGSPRADIEPSTPRAGQPHGHERRDLAPGRHTDVHAADAELGPVVISELPPGQRRTTAPAGGATATQTISVTIVAGDLSVEPSSLQVDVVDGQATIAPVTVVDARGALDGWTLCATTDRPGTRFRVVRSDVEDVYGDGRGIHAPSGASGQLLFATKGHGGGTYRFGGDVAFVGNDRSWTGEMTVHFDAFGGRGGC